MQTIEILRSNWLTALRLAEQLWQAGNYEAHGQQVAVAANLFSAYQQAMA